MNWEVIDIAKLDPAPDHGPAENHALPLPMDSPAHNKFALPKGFARSGQWLGVLLPHLLGRTGLLLCALVMTGCALGPEFQTPPAPTALGYQPAQDLGSPTAQTASTPATDPTREIPADWWHLFQSPQLNSLIDQAFHANPNLAAAQAALREAHQNVVAQQGFFYPTFGLEYLPSRTKLAGNMGGNSPGLQGNGAIIQTYSNPQGPAPYNAPVYYDFHTAQLTLSYTPDLLGLNRRQVEALEAQFDLQRFQLEATYITLASTVIAAALQEAAVREQIALNEAIVNDNHELLAILERQQQLGAISALEVSTQELALAQSEQALPPLHQQLEQARDLLRALVGQTPDHELGASFTLSGLHLPTRLPLSLPAQLVQQRPDVRAAEAQLHAANAQVGVALANRFPQFTLTGALGGMAATPGQMFQAGGGFFSLIGDLTQPLFAGGTLRAREQAAREALAGAGATYRSTVLTALQNVADTLHAIDSDQKAYEYASQAEQAAHRARDHAQHQLEAGWVSPVSLLSADQIWQQSRLALAQLQTNRLGDAAALYQALGGGWWNRSTELP